MINRDNGSYVSFPQLEKIISLIFEKKYVEAESQMELQSNSIPPDEAHRLIAISALLSRERGETNEAFRLMSQAISAKPEWLPHLYQLSAMLMEEGKWSDAIAILVKLIAVSRAKKDNYFLGEALFRKAFCLGKLGDTVGLGQAKAEIPEGVTVYINDRGLGIEDI
jgi:tetratricopeptide (TPR) repeat protein